MYKTTFQKFTLTAYRSFQKMLSSNSVFSKLSLTLLVLVLSAGAVPNWSYQNKSLKNWKWEIIKENQEIAPPIPGVPPDESHWSQRAGLQALNHKGKFYIFGGRTPIAIPGVPIPGLSIIHGDVWSSSDKGANWQKILASNPTIPGVVPDPNATAHWANRSYFQVVKKGSYMYVIGGQDFNIIDNPDYNPDNPAGPCGPFVPPQFCTAQIPFSQFFNDVWRSRDGVHWRKMIANQAIDPEDPNPRHWAGRAGLSAVSFKGYLYVMGGSVNDDSSIVGGAPDRIYFNDVWRSRDGRRWEKVGNAPWEPRAGGIAVVKGGYMYMIGGEEGFTCPDETPDGPPDFPGTFPDSPGTFPGSSAGPPEVSEAPCPPYFNDVWRTKDGIHWKRMIDNIDIDPTDPDPVHWAKRPGHQVVVAQNQLVLFGGFGLGDDNGVTPSNPSDVWVSYNGAKWEKVSDAPWNAQGSKDIKYDFDAVVEKGYGKFSDAIYTFGGDRETFDFTDPNNYKNVDNDVWKFSLPKQKEVEEVEELTLALFQNYPNPFSGSTTIKYTTPTKAYVAVKIFDKYGRFVTSLVGKTQDSGTYETVWNGKNYKGKNMRKGYYYVMLYSDRSIKTIKMYKK